MTVNFASGTVWTGDNLPVMRSIKVTLIALAVMTLLAPPATAFTGRDLLKASPGEFRAYVAGIVEGHILVAAFHKVPLLVCVGPGTTRRALAHKVRLRLQSRARGKPADLNLPARTVVLGALIRSYPCKRQ